MGFFDKPITANEEEANTGGDYTPIEEGVYKLLIEKSEPARSKANNEMLKLTFKVEEGKYEGRKLFHNLNLEHANDVVVKIAKGQLHALMILCGLKTIEAPQDLLGQSFEAKVIVKRREDTGAMQNEVLLTLAKPKQGVPPASDAKAAPATTKKW